MKRGNECIRYGCLMFLAVMLLYGPVLAIQTNPYVSVKEFGAIGDDGEDDTDAIRDAIDFCLDNPVPNGSGIYKLVFPTGTYLVSETLDLTKKQQDTFVIDFQGSTIIGAIAESGGLKRPVIDMTGTRFCRLMNGHIKGDSTSKPSVGILIARQIEADQKQSSASGHILMNMTIEGYFTVAGVYSHASELMTCHNLKIDNQEAASNAWAWYETATNKLDLTSEFTNIGTGTTSDIYHRFYGCSFATKSTDGVVYFNSPSGVIMNNCHFRSNSSQSVTQMVLADSSDGGFSGLEISNFTSEAANDPGYFIKFIGAGHFSGIRILPAGPVKVTSALIGLDGSAGLVKLHDAFLEGSVIDASNPKLITVISGNPWLENMVIRSYNGSDIDLGNASYYANIFYGMTFADNISDVGLYSTARTSVITTDRVIKKTDPAGVVQINANDVLTSDISNIKVTGQTNPDDLKNLYLNNVQDGEEVWLRGGASAGIVIHHNSDETGNIFLSSGANKTIYTTTGIKLKWSAANSRWIED